VNVSNFTLPRPLVAGANIGLFAPSGLINVERHEKSVRRLQELGYRVTVADEAPGQWRYFAGTDEQRVTSFHRQLADADIDALMMIRGGYGWSRLLHLVDWNLVRSANKPLIGFSDFTALSLGALSQADLITFAGPGATIDFGGQDDDEQTRADHAYMEENCWPVLRGETWHAGPFASNHNFRPQSIEGTLWGSNLSLLAHLAGTPYMPQIHDGILFLEEIGEKPYAVERMFLQLFHAGILQRQQALVLGDFTDCEPEPGRFPYAMEHVVDTLRSLLKIPILTGLPFGHVARKLTLPYGAGAQLDIEPGSFVLTLNI
jgi:muramoyltetrapeptide carboxypeptidase